MLHIIRMSFSFTILFHAAVGCTNKQSLERDACPVKIGTEYEILQPLCLAKSVSRTAEIADTVEKVVGLGARTIRSDFVHRIEPQQGEWDFDHHDQVVNAFSEKGIEVIPLLAYGVPWALLKRRMITIFRLMTSRFCKLRATVAERYKDNIQRFEIWNEPNAGFDFGNLISVATQNIWGIGDCACECHSCCTSRG